MKKLDELLKLTPADFEKAKTEDLVDMRLFLQNTRIAIQEKMDEIVKVLDKGLSKSSAMKKLSPEERAALGLTPAQAVQPDPIAGKAASN